MLANIGKAILGFIVKYAWDYLVVLATSWYNKWKQRQIDQENLKRYEEVKSGGLSNEEDIKRTEDLLSGRKPN